MAQINFPKQDTSRNYGREVNSRSIEKNGRHEETRTPDLYRVKVQANIIFNDIEDTGGTVSHWKYVMVILIVYHDVYHAT